MRTEFESEKAVVYFQHNSPLETMAELRNRFSLLALDVTEEYFDVRVAAMEETAHRYDGLNSSAEATSIPARLAQLSGRIAAVGAAREEAERMRNEANRLRVEAGRLITEELNTLRTILEARERRAAYQARFSESRLVFCQELSWDDIMRRGSAPAA
jgi:hypothetical protein